MWTCSKCGEKLKADFEVCWSCGTSKAGGEDTTFQRAEDVGKVEEVAGRVEWEANPLPRGASLVTPCRACGSPEVIPDVRVMDQGKYSDGDLQVIVCGDPDALIFKDRAYGVLRARVCGACGFTDLWVANSRELYAKYLKSKGEDV